MATTDWDVREDKLPRWARDRLRNLREEVAVRDRTITSLRGTAAPSRLFIERRASYPPMEEYLPEETIVTFLLGKDATARRVGEIRFRLTQREGRYIVEAMSHPGIYVMPSASNVAHLGIMERD